MRICLCTKCGRKKPVSRFTQIELDRADPVCKYCNSQSPSAFIDAVMVEAKCMMCEKIYTNDFPFGLCGSCKKTEAYENEFYATDFDFCND